MAPCNHLNQCWLNVNLIPSSINFSEITFITVRCLAYCRHIIVQVHYRYSTSSLNVKSLTVRLNTLRLRWNRCHFVNNIFQCIFLNENILIAIKIPLKHILNSQINNIPALVHRTAWCWPGDKQLSEPMMTIVLIHICITQPQWVDGCRKLTISLIDIHVYCMLAAAC